MEIDDDEILEFESSSNVLRCNLIVKSCWCSPAKIAFQRILSSCYPRNREKFRSFPLIHVTPRRFRWSFNNSNSTRNWSIKLWNDIAFGNPSWICPPLPNSDHPTSFSLHGSVKIQNQRLQNQILGQTRNAAADPPAILFEFPREIQRKSNVMNICCQIK